MEGKLFDPELLKAVYEGISSQGWIYIENVLSPEELQAINHFFKIRADSFQLASVIDDGKIVKNEIIRGDRFLAVDCKNPPAEVKDIILFLNKLKEGLNKKLQLGIEDLQCHPSVFPPTFFFKKHIDAYGEEASHVITYVFYVHEAWSVSDGGSLVLYNNNNEKIVNIIPAPGSFIAFKSCDFPHEVKMCFKERRSITGWFHNRLLE